MRYRHQVSLLISVLHKKVIRVVAGCFPTFYFMNLKSSRLFLFFLLPLYFPIQMKKHNLFMCQLEHLPQFVSMRAPHYRHHYYYYYYKIRIQREL